MTVVRKIHSKLLFFVYVPQTATKLCPKVHKQWVTPANNTVCVLGKPERAFMCYQTVSVLVVRFGWFHRLYLIVTLTNCTNSIELLCAGSCLESLWYLAGREFFIVWN